MNDVDDAREHIADPYEVFSHGDFLKTLATSLASKRMHHSWLLTGSRGIGKASVARLAAACLLSERQSSALAGLVTGKDSKFSISMEDPGANLVFNGAHPDYLSISPALDDNKSGQIKIDQIRDMIPFMAHKPARGGWRVTVIDSMDEVNRNGANAMLKLLEEPPEKSVIFLVSSRPGQLPPTIRSRCHVVRLFPLKASLCRDLLTKKLTDTDAERIDLLVLLSGGAPGLAILLNDSAAVECYEVACSLLSAPKIDVDAMVKLTSKWGKGGAAGRASRQGAIFCLGRLLRLLALTANGGNIPATCQFEKQIISVLCSRHSPLQLAKFYDEFLEESAKAEGLYLDFSQVLLRQMIKLYQKTLP